MGEPSMEVGAMPKEYTHSTDFARVFKDPDGKSFPVDYTSAKVSWDRQSENVSLSIIDYEKDPDGMDEAVKYLNLSRTGINRLITTLRRARDSAFGKDA
jgi:hypothetical protein